MKSLGEQIRERRVAVGLLLREVAAELKIDPSLLSRIERGEKYPTREQVIQLTKLLKIAEGELLVAYLSDKIVYELQNEDLAFEAMAVAEKKLSYYAKGKGRKRNAKRNST